MHLLVPRETLTSLMVKSALAIKEKFTSLPEVPGPDWVSGLFCQFFPERRLPHSDFHPELLSGSLKVSSCSGHDLIFIDVDGKC